MNGWIFRLQNAIPLIGFDSIFDISLLDFSPTSRGARRALAFRAPFLLKRAFVISTEGRNDKGKSSGECLRRKLATASCESGIGH
jgi:hypothetical protein